MNKDNLHIARQKRGQIVDEQLSLFFSFSDKELISLLKSEIPINRTIGASLLGQRNVIESVEHLCEALKVEKLLYSKIAICEALEKIGEASIKPLLKLLGKIGNNHETVLPAKYFEKKSYPLARDIVARTLINIGKPAIDSAIELVKTSDKHLLSQVIDTLGGLLSKTKEQRIHGVLTTIYKNEQQNELLLWKTIRAFSAIENSETTNLILPNLQDKNPAIVWETIRTLGLITTYDLQLMEKLNTFSNYNNEQIKQAAKEAISRIRQREKDTIANSDLRQAEMSSYEKFR